MYWFAVVILGVVLNKSNRGTPAAAFVSQYWKHNRTWKVVVI